MTEKPEKSYNISTVCSDCNGSQRTVRIKERQRELKERVGEERRKGREKKEGRFIPLIQSYGLVNQISIKPSFYQRITFLCSWKAAGNGGRIQNAPMDYETLFMSYVTEMAWIESERDGRGWGVGQNKRMGANRYRLRYVREPRSSRDGFKCFRYGNKAVRWILQIKYYYTLHNTKRYYFIESKAMGGWYAEVERVQNYGVRLVRGVRVHMRRRRHGDSDHGVKNGGFSEPWVVIEIGDVRKVTYSYITYIPIHT